MRIGRRGFINWFLGTSLGALFTSVTFPVVRFISPPDVPESTTNRVDAGSISDPELLQKGFKILHFGNEPVILIKAGEGDYRAFSATCTHLQCIVEYRKPLHVIWCNCHNGEYDLNGRNIAGPPPRPLKQFAVHLVERAGEPPSLIVERA